MFKKLIFNNFIAGRIAALFGGLKGYKSQVGTVAILALTAVKYFAPVPIDWLPFVDKAIEIIIGATGISLGDKFRRNYEIGKTIIEDVANKVPVAVEPTKP